MLVGSTAGYLFGIHLICQLFLLGILPVSSGVRCSFPGQNVQFLFSVCGVGGSSCGRCALLGESRTYSSNK